MEGTAFFPYLNKDITVVCRKGVSCEYTEKCLEYLEEMADALMLQICKYAESFLKDTLENTSVGELGDEETFPYDSLMDLRWTPGNLCATYARIANGIYFDAGVSGIPAVK